jgi:hypothetical protein
MDVHFLYGIFQALTVSALVAGCTLYCLLMLAPNGLKRRLKLVLLRCPLPSFVSSLLTKTTASGACGGSCGACSSGSAKTQTVKWHPRKH